MANDAIQLFADKLIIKDGGLVLDPACCCGPPPDCNAAPFEVNAVENCLDLTGSGLGPTFTPAEFEAYLASITPTVNVPDSFYAAGLTGCAAPDTQCEDMDGWVAVLTYVPGSFGRWFYEQPDHPEECFFYHKREANLIISCTTEGLCKVTGDWTITSLTGGSADFVLYEDFTTSKIDLGALNLAIPFDEWFKGNPCDKSGTDGPLLFT